jgi:hypothetical protein
MQGEAERALRCRPPSLPNRPHFDADSIDSALPRTLDSTAGKNMQAIAMGYGGMYNCDNPANMRYESVTEGARLMQKFVADREIKAGDELTINYSGKSGASFFRYQLRVLIRAASCKIERQFATFADVPYHDPLSRQQWEQLWRAEPQ